MPSLLSTLFCSLSNITMLHTIIKSIFLIQRDGLWLDTHDCGQKRISGMLSVPCCKAEVLETRATDWETPQNLLSLVLWLKINLSAFISIRLSILNEILRVCLSCTLIKVNAKLAIEPKWSHLNYQVCWYQTVAGIIVFYPYFGNQ